MLKTIVLTGGGTCGHIMPNIALIPLLKKHFEHIVYLGQSNSQEESIAKKYRLEFMATPAIKLHRRKIFKNFAIPFVLPKAINTAKQILLKLQPTVIFSKGGFVSLPIALAAKKLDIPVITHESDMTLGLANKIIAKSATYIITSHKESPLPCPKYKYIGNPIRSELINGNSSKLGNALCLRPNYPDILVFGGSLGAKAINDVIYSSLQELTVKYNVLHITGNIATNGNIKTKGYYPIPFADNMGDYYAAADLIISRAGASAISEISAVAKRVIYIPLPQGASRGDQVDNAKAAAKHGALVLEQDNLSKSTLLKHIDKAFALPPPQKLYDATIPQRIVDLVLSVCR